MRNLSSEKLLICFSIVLVGAILTIQAHGAGSAAAQEHPVAQPGWHQADRLELQVEVKQQQYRATFLFDVAGNGDRMISIDETAASKKEAGKIMVIAGRVMLTQGLSLEAGQELKSLDSSALLYQLTVKLLNRAAKEGPLSVEKARKVKIEEVSEDIELSTTSAGGVFAAPWVLNANLMKQAKNKVGYDLTFQARALKDKEKIIAMELSGTWQQFAQRAAFPDDMPLEGWKVYFIGRIEKEQGGKKIYQYGATPQKLEASNLGQLRQMIKTIQQQ